MRAGKYESKAERDFYLERIGRSKAALLDELWRVASRIVRCGECRYYDEEYSACTIVVKGPALIDDFDYYSNYIPQDLQDFCSHGKRRQDNETDRC